MKRGLLFALALGLGSWVYGQSTLQTDYKQDPRPQKALNVQDLQVNDIPGPVNFKKSDKGVVSSVTLGYSNNVYTMLVEQQSVLTANEDLGLIQFTHRAKVGEVGAVSSGDIISTRSSDGGNTWSAFMVMSNTTGHNNRYPGGVIHNPTGNTNVNNAFSAYVGPVSDGAGWTETFAGSIQLDSAYVSNSLLPSQGELIRNGLVACTDGKVHVVGATTNEIPYYHDTTFILTGTFNSTNSNFDWTYDKFHHDFVLDADGDVAAYAWFWNNAWSADGTIGYYWTIGRDSSNDTRSYQPLVWKTTNSGTTWAMMPVFDFSTLTNLTDYLRPMQGLTTSRPAFSPSLDGVVDANGDLHLISYIRSSSSDGNDSLTWLYTYSSDKFSNPIFDIYTTSSGWEARHLGDLYTFDVPAAESGYGSGTANETGWDLRLQAGKTTDGTKIFASWTDSDTTIAPVGADGNLLNMFPDIIVAAWDIVTLKQTNATNFTIGTSLYGDCYFHYMSDVVFSNNGTYTVPITEIDKGIDPLNPITHNYVKGIEFTDADFVSNPGFKSSIDNIVTVSQNRPNPFNGITSIDVNLDKASSLSIEVINITGQKVYEMNYGSRTAGTHTIDINGSSLASGIYFYTVHAGNSSVTKKMIVE